MPHTPHLTIALLILARINTHLNVITICSGLIAPDTLIRDNLNPILRCHYESETTI